jgi:hypothetical protein
MSTTEKLIWDVWDAMMHDVNNGILSISSERAVVFHFAWRLAESALVESTSLDFEKPLYAEFDEGEFLDLYALISGDAGKESWGFEFKFPRSKNSNSDQTVQRQKATHDLKRLTWLVDNDRINRGCFLMVVNEKNYIEEGGEKQFMDSHTYNGKAFNSGTLLPVNSKSNSILNSICKIEFSWNNYHEVNGKYWITEGQVAYIDPIVIKKGGGNNHVNF